MNYRKQLCCFRTYCAILMLAFTAATLHSSAQTVRFTINGKQNDCAPHALSFTNMSDNGATAYLWDFGQGSTATTRDAGVTYLNPGSYKVTLTVTYPSGPKQYSENIEVYARPVPQFSVSNVIGCTPLPIQFTDQSTPGSGTLQNVTWDFGDGVITSDPNPSHIYTVGGNFSINIIATNSFGCSAGLEKARLINVGETPQVNFTADAYSSCTTPLKVSITSSGPAGLIYAWDLGNGTTSTDANPVVDYTQEGRFTVVLRAKNAQGCEAVISKPAFVTIEKTKADFTTQGPVCTGTNVPLINTTMPRPTLSTWTLPDGRKTFGTDASYYFSAPGDYVFTLESGLPGCMETITKTITVHESPVASFIATPPQGCSIPFNTQFTSQSTGAAEWHWIFGDGTTADGLNPTHTYTRFDRYDVSLMIKSAAGCEANVTLRDYIRVEEPDVRMFISNPEGCLPHSTSFGATLLSAGMITGYSWDFGDGTTSTAPTPSHTYTTEGVFNVRLIVNITGGCQYTIDTTVRAGEIPIVNFDGDPKNPCQRYPVNFVNQSVPRGTEWLWYFPDDNGSIETAENPSHIFRTIGKHDVTLTVSNYGCRRTLTKIDFITILPPIANFMINRNCNDRYTVNFVDNSDFGPIPGTPRFWSWDFGDNSPLVTIPSPTHVYAAPGTYTIRLTVNDGNCESVHAVTIEVIDEKPIISALNTEICAGSGVTFTRGNTNPANIVSYYWSWGDNTYAPVPGTSISKQYDTPGDYNVYLSILDRNGCASTSNIIPVKVNGAVGDFNFTGRNCKGDEQSFTDASTPSHGYNLRSWTWSFGDGTTPQVLQTKPVDYKHAFAQMGTYNVQLRIEDNAGCITTVTKPVPVTGVTAQFRTASTISCVNSPLQFSNASTGSNLSYAWQFGDGGTGTDQHPVHVYTQPGEFDVTLTATNAIGCTETITKGKYVVVPDPVAKFSIPANLPVCPPVLVQFTNESTGYVRSVWDFGDGSRSNLANPSHVFNRPGRYTIRLDVYSNGDCINSITQEVVIQGPTGTRDFTPKTGCMPHEITLTATSSNAVKYIWDLDNGNVQTTTTNSYKYTYDKQGVYYPRVILEDAQGCRVPAEGSPDSIIVDQAKASFVLDDSQACDFGDVIFSNSSTSLSYLKHQQPQSYRWDFGVDNRTDDVSTALNPTFHYVGVGTYQAKLVITSFHGCMDSLTLPVKVDPLPDTRLAPVNPICAGDSILFEGSENKNLPGTKWTWLLDDQPTNATGSRPRMVFRTPGNHQVKLVIRNENNKCPDIAMVPVSVNPLPTVNVMPKQAVICLGETLEIRSNASPATYSWTNYNISDAGSANPRVNPVRDTTYRVRVINSFGCIVNDSARITVSQPFQVQSYDAVICSGKQTQLTASGALRYRWIPSTGLSRADIATPFARPATTTQYQVIGYGNDACFTDTANVLVTVNPSPEITTGPGRVVPAGTEVTLNVQGSPDIIKWQWYPDKWITCIDCPDPIATPKGDVTYNITATNQFGCATIALLPIKLVCPASTAFIPNTFSPNGDGQNDLFYVRGKGISGIKSFKIFNRWGQMVFERSNCNTDDPGCGWDGKFGGVLLNPDVYIYYVEMTCDSNEPLLVKGNVTLLR
ncbi:PKD domain-containing protein [Chitinophaga sp. SYP-B3965]|uniref:PKD domain-containing protein n=1 Tax=Chitinophaga sp. SYP-B3965 TaxID=2663120 RepID=UPI001299EE11|nr:PKD domain-containing protein [Chitinophaga sp. SYP-B3965]MRG48212.1 PKD domain-containing protein [Chitinophaga sp. SYP-B3965]